MNRPDWKRIISRAAVLARQYKGYGMDEDDVAAEIFLLLVRRKGRFDESRSSWNTFLNVTINYAMREFLRNFAKYNARVVLYDPQAIQDYVDFDEDLFDMKVDLENAIKKCLDVDEQELCQKYFIEGYSVKELADGKDAKLIKKRLKSVVSKLRREFAE